MRGFVGLVGVALVISSLNAAAAWAQRTELRCQPVVLPAPDCTLKGYFERTMTTECHRA